jgi:hypothetical protein
MLKLVQIGDGVFDLAFDDPALADDAAKAETLVYAVLFTDAEAPVERVAERFDRRGWWADPARGSGLWYLRRQALGSAARSETLAMIASAISGCDAGMSEVVVNEVAGSASSAELVQVAGLYRGKPFVVSGPISGGGLVSSGVTAMPPAPVNQFVYATWNPLTNPTDVTLSNGNLSASSLSGAVLSTIGKMAGKWYWEIACVSNNGGSGFYDIGISKSIPPSDTGPLGQNIHSWGLLSYAPAGTFLCNATTSIAYPYPNGSVPYVDGDVIGVALDMDAGSITFYRNGVPYELVGAGSNYDTGFLPTPGKEWFAAFSTWSGGTVDVTANFGASPFAYPVPAGFNAGLYQ